MAKLVVALDQRDRGFPCVWVRLISGATKDRFPLEVLTDRTRSEGPLSALLNAVIGPTCPSLVSRISKPC